MYTSFELKPNSMIYLGRVEAVIHQRKDDSELRAGRVWSTTILWSGRRLESAISREEAGGLARCCSSGTGWGAVGVQGCGRCTEVFDGPAYIYDTPFERAYVCSKCQRLQRDGVEPVWWCCTGIAGCARVLYPPLRPSHEPRQTGKLQGIPGQE